MRPSPFKPPGKTVAREQVPPYREILFNPETRKFHWEDAWPTVEPAVMDDGTYKMTVMFTSLSPEEISDNIDDDTMAKCLALAINPAR